MQRVGRPGLQARYSHDQRASSPGLRLPRSAHIDLGVALLDGRRDLVEAAIDMLLENRGRRAAHTCCVTSDQPDVAKVSDSCWCKSGDIRKRATGMNAQVIFAADRLTLQRRASSVAPACPYATGYASHFVRTLHPGFAWPCSTTRRRWTAINDPSFSQTGQFR
jgi:hypothetical protein